MRASLTPSSGIDALSRFGSYVWIAFAIRAYRHGLGLLARRNARPQARAFLYRRIGEAQEDLHRMDLAYDAYTKALELYPDEPYAKKRAVALVQGNGF